MLSGIAAGDLPRRAIRTRLEMQVPQAAPAPGREQRSVAISRKVGQFFTGLFIRDYGPDRHNQFDVLTTRTIAIRTATVLTVRRPVDACVAVIDQRVDIAVGPRPNAATPATIAAIRSALGNELFSAERCAAIAPLSGDHLDQRFIDEFHGFTNEKGPAGRQGLLNPSAVRELSASAGRSRRGGSVRR